MKTTKLFAILLAALVAISSSKAVTIEMVPVGNPGNASDTRYYATGFGSVGYVYQIGKYEVTAGQYTEFLNAVAKADPNGLYNPAMGDPANFGANIQRTGSSPNFGYSVVADWANRPVNNVSLWDAARFANWLDNGQPVGAQGPGTTEGGAYHDVGNQELFGRKAGARFFLPTHDEWYKAAYHDKTGGPADIYFDYATGSNLIPGRDITELSNQGNNANYFKTPTIFTIGSPYYRTVVGEFELSDSPYGTFDQGGNVTEWAETAFSISSRVLNGGSFYDNSGNMRASGPGNLNPIQETYGIGFRVASSVTGDYNGNGRVDAADYVMWRNNLGNSVLPCSGGDANCNGFVENTEYQPWRENFGRTINSPTAAGNGMSATTTNVPEPSLLALLGVVIVGLIGGRFDRHYIGQVAQHV